MVRLRIIATVSAVLLCLKIIEAQELRRSGFMGISAAALTDEARKQLRPNETGILVQALVDGGSAKAAGIEPRDVIIQIDGRDVKEWRDLPRIVADTPIGKEIAVTIVRNSKELTKTVKIGRVEYADEQGDAPQAKSAKADARSETAVKHLAPALMTTIENQQTTALRFGKRPIDRFTRASN